MTDEEVKDLKNGSVVEVQLNSPNRDSQIFNDTVLCHVGAGKLGEEVMKPFVAALTGRRPYIGFAVGDEFKKDSVLVVHVNSPKSRVVLKRRHSSIIRCVSESEPQQKLALAAVPAPKPASYHPAQIENVIGYAIAIMGLRPDITLADAVKQVLVAMKEIS